MRRSLISSLLETMRYNVNHNNSDIKIFEIGRIFIPKGKETEEREMVSGIISGLRYGEAWSVRRDAVDFYDIKGVVEQILTGLGVANYTFTAKADILFLHPGKGGVFEVNGKPIGMTGEAHPDTLQSLDIKQPAYIFELDLQAIMTVMSSQKGYRPIPKYPMIIRDAAMIVNREIPFQELYDAVKGAGIKLLEKVDIFDVYYGENIPEGKLSIALRFVYRSSERTLTDNEVNNVHVIILDNLKNRFGVEIRGEA